MSTERIRKALTGDVETLTSLFNEYRMFYKKQADIEHAKDFLLDRIMNDDSEIFLCFNDDNKMVGFVQLYPLFSSTRMRKLWLLNDLYVKAEYRFHGYAAQLIDKAKELCRLTNACGIMLETAKDNAAGNHLYTKTGFILDTEHNYYSWDDE